MLFCSNLRPFSSSSFRLNSVQLLFKCTNVEDRSLFKYGWFLNFFTEINMIWGFLHNFGAAFGWRQCETRTGGRSVMIWEVLICFTSVKVNNLVKSYGSTMAVKGISFGVEQHECFGLLGLNGAGETTEITVSFPTLIGDHCLMKKLWLSHQERRAPSRSLPAVPRRLLARRRWREWTVLLLRWDYFRVFSVFPLCNLFSQIIPFVSCLSLPFPAGIRLEIVFNQILRFWN